MDGYVVDIGDMMKKQKFNSPEEEQHFINAVNDQVLNTEEKIDEATKSEGEGGLVRAADAPQPLKPSTFYQLAREYHNYYEKLTELYNLREVYQGQIDKYRNAPNYFESPEAVYTYQDMQSRIQNDSGERLNKLLEETQRYAQRMEKIPMELLHANMPYDSWINDDVTGKAYKLIKGDNGRYRLDVEDGEKIRRKLLPTKTEKAVDTAKGINYTKYLAIREKGEVILLPSAALWGIYSGIIGFVSWIVF